MTLKERVEEEIRKGIEEARRNGVVIPNGNIDVVITPVPVPDEETN